MDKEEISGAGVDACGGANGLVGGVPPKRGWAEPKSEEPELRSGI
jgi:hypothetical protein